MGRDVRQSIHRYFAEFGHDICEAIYQELGKPGGLPKLLRKLSIPYSTADSNEQYQMLLNHFRHHGTLDFEQLVGLKSLDFRLEMKAPTPVGESRFDILKRTIGTGTGTGTGSGEASDKAETRPLPLRSSDQTQMLPKRSPSDTQVDETVQGKQRIPLSHPLNALPEELRSKGSTTKVPKAVAPPVSQATPPPTYNSRVSVPGVPLKDVLSAEPKDPAEESTQRLVPATQAKPQATAPTTLRPVPSPKSAPPPAAREAAPASPADPKASSPGSGADLPYDPSKPHDPNGTWPEVERRSGRERRQKPDRRQAIDIVYKNKRYGKDRRQGGERRKNWPRGGFTK